MDSKQARTEVEKRNLEIGILCEQIMKVKKQHEAELKAAETKRIEDSKRLGIAESELDRKIEKMGEIQFIIDEKNALQDKLTALEAKYLENTRDLVSTRNKCITLQQQHDNLMHMVSELNGAVHSKT